ncbi:hypothetical protein M9H77_13341 [Catharanthus roseus]|uniref:Uncharacterized protein n=1 Tax=Catharanthus roseus TaxID=4058 RepID=A0ACC0BK45_CATRO|nr:hypothetical protein M9H77_13341 [Catharanthus roseus]
MSILHLLANDPKIPMSNIIQEMQVLFQTGCTYKWAWYARKFAIVRVFGSWETTFNILLKYLQAVQDLNPGTVYEFLHHRISSPPNYVFKFVFWCFSPCIDGFPYCRPVISVDGTHLRGSYKGESSESWNWFLKNLREYIVKDCHVCLISDRHKGIFSAIQSQPLWQPLFAVHWFCLRHIRANFNKTFKNTNLKSLMWQAGTESKQWKFDRVMKEIQERNVDTYIYLMKLDPEKWTLLHDGGHRHDIRTTNIFEALNSVLKKARVLLLKALVELIFNKLVKYFHQHREEAENCVHPFPT